MADKENGSYGFREHLKNLWKSGGLFLRIFMIVIPAMVLVFLIAFFSILSTKGFSDAAIMLVPVLMVVVVFGGALLIGVENSRPRRNGEKSQLWRYLLAFCGACMLFAGLISLVLPPKGKPASSSGLIIWLILAIPLLLPLLIHLFRKH